ncbi:tricarballylate utilization 4Fe-4S protein TcuB [Thioalkalivibrio sp. HK1]|uniref:tricarballylate utilization 4Fe-4S protein TcuB n=1 Tax=Thioalkalivibrio sp. HK1 TaxID=1469245 RepID=UPI0004710D60|nr:tricarballylate utilization 4Fe-4S protein TcuB [Thioalkalivibrio sp. HK1]
MQAQALIDEGARVMSICNACRYCEGHCALFKAMTSRLEFNAETLDYLSNLCHDCGACYHHCQYAAPHAFDVNIPAVMTELRRNGRMRHIRPGFMRFALQKSGLATIVLSLISIVAFIVPTAISGGGGALFEHHLDSFYGVISHGTMVSVFGAAAVFLMTALILSIRSFHKGLSLPASARIDLSHILQGIRDGLSLRYLGGGAGQGCTWPSQRPSTLRRTLHHFGFWGFMLCFAATCAGTLMHYGLDLPAPYGFISAPKILGTLGGIGLLIGPAGLLILKARVDPNTKPKEGSRGTGSAFSILLILVSASGLALMAVRDTPSMGIVLCLHLGFVMTLFLLMPWGKFVHGFYRSIALIVFAMESRAGKALAGTDLGVPSKRDRS